MTSGGPSASPRETATCIRPRGPSGVEALHASFVTHEYRPHPHPTWTVAMMERGAAALRSHLRPAPGRCARSSKTGAHA